MKKEDNTSYSVIMLKSFLLLLISPFSLPQSSAFRAHLATFT